MSLASSQLSFLAAARCPRRTNNLLHSSNAVVASKLPPAADDPDGLKRGNENQLAKLAIVTLATGVLTLGISVHDASAAKTGGRIGGQAFRSAAPRPSSPRINNNSRTNIYINPRVAPPLVGGYGYGYGYGVPYYGGWGWSPFSFFAPSPSVAVGIGGDFDVLLLFIFLGTLAAFVRRFFGRRSQEVDDDDDDY